ncbi:Glycosyl transferase family 2 [Flexibacter flexilis DSM 6793]|uniref:Glycosyl transferase family 2 n=1 Tax=Flexibacter flexilis DSM 6793 TaxID=927664 RepID=A0A1I1EAE5_9BACT|nr:glycosyltransferase [Flexibacter flexilis]SFB84094.1 Glycosyl transferase family 2 [Flexibacter flexilis DSM 6793]
MPNSLPLVSVICLCYKHARFVAEALDSVLAQTYPHWELIIIDDQSPDNSVTVIQDWITQHTPQPQAISFLALEQNVGNCAAFNRGLAQAKGQYVIDFAADDVLLPQRLAEQVSLLEANPQAAAAFADALLISETGQPLHTHFRRDANGKLLETVASGNIFRRLFLGHFICSPTLMFRAQPLRALGGYDETLAYEDFDVMMRLARNWDLLFQDSVQTKYRVVRGSLSQQFYTQRQNKMLSSTLIICQKADNLCINQEEKQALAVFVRYHLRQSAFMHNPDLVQKYANLLQQMGLLDWTSKLILTFSRFGLNLYPIYKCYLWTKKYF